jgi:hypothetical protein
VARARPVRRRVAIPGGRCRANDHQSGIANPYPRSDRAFLVNSGKLKGYVRENQRFRKVFTQRFEACSSNRSR